MKVPAWLVVLGLLVLVGAGALWGYDHARSKAKYEAFLAARDSLQGVINLRDVADVERADSIAGLRFRNDSLEAQAREDSASAARARRRAQVSRRALDRHVAGDTTGERLLAEERQAHDQQVQGLTNQLVTERQLSANLVAEIGIWEARVTARDSTIAGLQIQLTEAVSLLKPDPFFTKLFKNLPWIAGGLAVGFVAGSI